MAFGLAAMVSGCGFHPLYGGANLPTQAELRGIIVGPITAPNARRAGQLISNDLEDELAPQGRERAPRFQLEATVSETNAPMLVNAQSQVTRNQFSLVTTYRLVVLRTNQVVLSGSLQRMMSYDVLRINYGNIVGAEDARRRRAQEITDEIATRIAVWLTNHEKTGG